MEAVARFHLAGTSRCSGSATLVKTNKGSVDFQCRFQCSEVICKAQDGTGRAILEASQHLQDDAAGLLVAVHLKVLQISAAVGHDKHDK